MKLTSAAIFALAVTLLALATSTLAAPLPAGPPHPASAVVLKLGNGRIARCTLPTAPSRAKADMVSSKLVASGKMACKDTLEHPRGGKTMTCDLGQHESKDEGMGVLKDACESHEGVHVVM